MTPKKKLPITLARPEHTLSRSLVDDDALWVLRRLRRSGYLAYIVGGAVRDILLGREPKDFDIGTNARPSEVKALFRNCRLIGRRFRLAHVFFRRKGAPDKIVEVTTFRGLEKMEDDSHLTSEDRDKTGAVFGSPEDDAMRRDFTINALLYNFDDFSIIDYAGGLSDLESKKIRLIGEPDERFSEDPVRMLRAIEFAARLGFTIERKTASGIKANAHLISESSPARLRDEVRQMQHLGIVGEVFREASRLGLFEHLYPEVEVSDGIYHLLKPLDDESKKGRSQQEYRYIAALALPTVVNHYPLTGEARLDEAAPAITEVVTPLCARYQISAHIRHQAKEIILSCYRFAKGKHYRAKGKFARRKDFAEAWEFYSLWAAFDDSQSSAAGYWGSYLEERNTPLDQKKKPRKRSGRRRRRPSKRGAPPTS
ncbi:MAG: CCA tRNA nucleotidyltransferase [Deltaproteobacteria bacterium]|nr:MAG: CCA tRNA nucleotidyltransferase [Deltaproteobacteria bacterium]